MVVAEIMGFVNFKMFVKSLLFGLDEITDVKFSVSFGFFVSVLEIIVVILLDV